MQSSNNTAHPPPQPLARKSSSFVSAMEDDTTATTARYYDDFDISSSGGLGNSASSGLGSSLGGGGGNLSIISDGRSNRSNRSNSQSRGSSSSLRKSSSDGIILEKGGNKSKKKDKKKKKDKYFVVSDVSSHNRKAASLSNIDFDFEEQEQQQQQQQSKGKYLSVSDISSHNRNAASLSNLEFEQSFEDEPPPAFEQSFEDDEPRFQQHQGEPDFEDPPNNTLQHHHHHSFEGEPPSAKTTTLEVIAAATITVNNNKGASLGSLSSVECWSSSSGTDQIENTSSKHRVDDDGQQPSPASQTARHIIGQNDDVHQGAASSPTKKTSPRRRSTVVGMITTTTTTNHHHQQHEEDESSSSKPMRRAASEMVGSSSDASQTNSNNDNGTPTRRRRNTSATPEQTNDEPPTSSPPPPSTAYKQRILRAQAKMATEQNIGAPRPSLIPDDDDHEVEHNDIIPSSPTTPIRQSKAYKQRIQRAQAKMAREQVVVEGAVDVITAVEDVGVAPGDLRAPPLRSQSTGDEWRQSNADKQRQRNRAKMMKKPVRTQSLGIQQPSMMVIAIGDDDFAAEAPALAFVESSSSSQQQQRDGAGIGNSTGEDDDAWRQTNAYKQHARQRNKAKMKKGKHQQDGPPPPVRTISGEEFSVVSPTAGSADDWRQSNAYKQHHRQRNKHKMMKEAAADARPLSPGMMTSGLIVSDEPELSSEQLSQQQAMGNDYRQTNAYRQHRQRNDRHKRKKDDVQQHRNSNEPLSQTTPIPLPRSRPASMQRDKKSRNSADPGLSSSSPAPRRLVPHHKMRYHQARERRKQAQQQQQQQEAVFEDEHHSTGLTPSLAPSRGMDEEEMYSSMGGSSSRRLMSDSSGTRMSSLQDGSNTVYSSVETMNMSAGALPFQSSARSFGTQEAASSFAPSSTGTMGAPSVVTDAMYYDSADAIFDSGRGLPGSDPALQQAYDAALPGAYRFDGNYDIREQSSDDGDDEWYDQQPGDHQSLGRSMRSVGSFITRSIRMVATTTTTTASSTSLRRDRQRDDPASSSGDSDQYSDPFNVMIDAEIEPIKPEYYANNSRRKQWFVVAILVLVLIITIVVGVILGTSGGGGDVISSSSSAPSSSPVSTNAPTPIISDSPFLAPAESLEWRRVGQALDGSGVDDNFGFQVAISEDGSIVASSTKHADEGVGRNYVQVFRLDGGDWIQLGDDFETQDRSFIDLAMNGTVISIASIGRTPKTINGVLSPGLVGVVRVYSWDGTTWAQVGQDIDASEAASRTFGFETKLSDDASILAVGDPEYDLRRGSVTLYTLGTDSDTNATSWIQIGQQLEGDASGNAFGISIAMNGDGSHVAVGTRKPAVGSSNAATVGDVRVYALTENVDSWTQVGSNLNPGRFGGVFGRSISLSRDGKTIAVGDDGFDERNQDEGAVEILDLVNDIEGWQRADFIIGNTRLGGTGRSVSLSADGSIVAVGTPFEIPRDVTAPGEVDKVAQCDVYQRSTLGKWLQLGTSIQASEHAFGSHVALSADGRMVVIADRYGGGSNGPNSGRVQVFRSETGA